MNLLYAPSGAIWIAKIKNLLNEKTFYGKNFRFYKMNFKSAIDIDNIEDLNFAVRVTKIKFFKFNTPSGYFCARQDTGINSSLYQHLQALPND